MKDVNRRSVFSMIAGFFGMGAVAVAKPSEPEYRSGVAISRSEKLLDSYHELLVLRPKHAAALRYMADTIPQGNAVMLYPCGCTASGPAYGTIPITELDGTVEHIPLYSIEGMPRYCGEHDSERKRESECTVVRGTLTPREYVATMIPASRPKPAFTFDKKAPSVEQSITQATDAISSQLQTYSRSLGAPNA